MLPTDMEFERTNKLTGLTAEQVRAQILRGKTNVVTTIPQRTIKDIIFANTFTLFNGLNFVLLLLVILAGQYKNGLFGAVIIVNTCIGIFQELRAKKTLDKLVVLNSFQAQVLRDGEFIAVPLEQIVLGDILEVNAGMQIPVDGVVRGNRADVDESLLTGEMDDIPKYNGEFVYSGSVVTAGSILIQALAIGDDMYINTLASKAKDFSLAKSELMDGIKSIIKVIMWIIIPVGLTLILTQIISTQATWQVAVLGAVAGITGMIPEGLVLLVSLAFMLGAVRLSRQHTLVQELPAIEGLARVDVLCLDKTGTLTEGNLKLAKKIIASKYTEEQFDEGIAALALQLPAANATQIALQEEYTFSNWMPKVIVPFSSANKWSGISYEQHGTWILGAPDVVMPETLSLYQQEITEQEQLGNRLLILAKSDSKFQNDQLPQNLEVVGFIAFEDVIRANAAETLQYFDQQQVDIKVISGDHPVTVASIANKVGVKNADKWIDAQTLPDSVSELQAYVKEYTVFGRVLPKQKQQLIQALQANGQTVAMTGDGVNDVLALKQADCGIAMVNGSEATRAVAQLVLLDSDFASLPRIVAEGRTVVNNIERVASLYLVKTMYSTILSILFIIIMKGYPFTPLQLSFISSLMVGIPTFFLALEKNDRKVEGAFLHKVLMRTVPAGLSIAVGVLLIYFIDRFLLMTYLERSTMAVILLGSIQFVILYQASIPLNKWKKAMLIIIGGLFIFGMIDTSFLTFMGMQQLSIWYYLLILVILGITILVMKAITKLMETYGHKIYGILVKIFSRK